MLRRKPSVTLCSGGNRPVHAKIGMNFKLFSSISLNSDMEEGQRMDAYLLNMASGRRFWCRAPKIASSLISLRAKGLLDILSGSLGPGFGHQAGPATTLTTARTRDSDPPWQTEATCTVAPRTQPVAERDAASAKPESDAADRGLRLAAARPA